MNLALFLAKIAVREHIAGNVGVNPVSCVKWRKGWICILITTFSATIGSVTIFGQDQGEKSASNARGQREET